MLKILVAEDDVSTNKLLCAILKINGYEAIPAFNGEAALDIIDHQHIDLLLCDVMMPKMDGFALTQAIRDGGSMMPILMLTAKALPEDKHTGFLVGTDDYMTKPPDKTELLLRIKALLRRARIVDEHKITVGDVVVDMDSRTVRRGMEVQTLPPKEFELLYKLLAYPERTFTRMELLDEIWGIDSESDDKTVNVHINRLRSGMETLNLTMLLILNLFFMVFLLLAVCTVLVLAGVDEGFLYHDGQVELGGALAFVYTVCILIAVSMVVMIRMVFIHPLQRNIEAMKKLANGDFTVRVNHAEHGYVPREMVEFEQSFNKAAEELGGTEILRKDFINNFSHEFKTPIVSISGFADLLLEEQLPPEDQKEYLTIIRDESRRLADLATNILTLNRVESQTILTDKAAFPLDEQLRQSVLVTQQKWRQKELDFDADLAPAEYTGSEGLLKEVWLNLLDNAAKFSPEGGTVAVNLRKEKSALMISVTDQGEGMRADTQAHIFEQFYQGDTSHTTQGNGLGLAMVKKVLELHGGSIQVNSALGQGSCFTVTLPI